MAQVTRQYFWLIYGGKWAYKNRSGQAARQFVHTLSLREHGAALRDYYRFVSINWREGLVWPDLAWPPPRLLLE